MVEGPVGTVLVTHPSADLYGSDLQLVESVAGMSAAGWRVVVTLPGPGPLEARLTDAGAVVEHLAVPVLRKALLDPLALATFAWACARSLPGMVGRLRRLAPDAVYVNTVTVPLWLVAARLARRPALCHVHEAEEVGPRLLAVALHLPLLAARSVVVNSRAARDVAVAAVPRLADRVTVVYNGVTGPPEPAPAIPDDEPASGRVVVVARLSPRKGVDVAVEAVARLRARGHDVDLELCGSVFAGYEWYEAELRQRASAADLAGHVHFSGYTSPTWPTLRRAAVVVVPSRAEPFGNTAVEGQLAGRPVVASAVQGLREIVTSERTGLLVPADDPDALADALARLLGDPVLAARLAADGQASARVRFSVQRYRQDIADAVAAVRGTRPS